MNHKTRALLNSDWSGSLMSNAQRLRHAQRCKEQREERENATKRANLAAMRLSVHDRFFIQKQTIEQIADELKADVDEVKRLVNRMRA